MKAVYLLLTRTRTVLSRVIHASTGDAYTHISIALDRDLTRLYSFGRRQAWMPLPAGLVQESVHAGVFSRNGRSPCLLLEMAVTDAQHDALHGRIAAMLDAKDRYRYSLLGILLLKLDLAHERHRHMFCSQFVASLMQLTGTLRMPKPPSLMRPADFVGLPGLKRCYEGPLALSDRIGLPGPSPADGCEAWPEHVY